VRWMTRSCRSPRQLQPKLARLSKLTAHRSAIEVEDQTRTYSYVLVLLANAHTYCITVCATVPNSLEGSGLIAHAILNVEETVVGQQLRRPDDRAPSVSRHLRQRARRNHMHTSILPKLREHDGVAQVNVTRIRALTSSSSPPASFHQLDRSSPGG
jgi:hypothetical protein